MRFLHILSALFLWVTATVSVDILPANGKAIADEYLVMLTAGMARPQFESALGLVTRALGVNDRMTFQYFFGDFRGFAVHASPTAMNIIRNIPGVEMVEQNEPIYLEQSNNNAIHQRPAPYGLDRLSHRNNYMKADRTPEFNYQPNVGRGTTIYIIDSGVYAENKDFNDRVVKGENYAPDNTGDHPNTFQDYDGHGTHVASIAAGFDYGVAKFAKIVDVKVLNDNGAGDITRAVAGLNFAADDSETSGTTNTSVINMSISYPNERRNSIMGYAVRSATRSGIVVVAAAGNQARNAENRVPAGVPEAFTVGAIDRTDTESDFSNFGDIVDIWAPGVDIPGAYIGSPTSNKTISGTSMAAPYVAGVVALLKSVNPNFYKPLTPEQTIQNLKDLGTKNRITFITTGGSPGPNIILYDGAEGV